MLPFTQNFAIVDIETTGQKAGNGRITEIAIVITDGVKILKKYSTLINPETPIPPFIVHLTGITNDMVKNAPTFPLVAREIEKYLSNTIFVAHNVAFDYGFIKAEFERCGYEFDRNRFCTVKLSRRAFEGFPSYSLGKLCNQLNIQITDRHRAMGDALATTTLFQMIVEKHGYPWIAKNISGGKKGLSFPPNINPIDINNLPTKAGVYYFINEKGVCIYVGKAIDIKKRVLSHFYSKRFKISEIYNEIHHVDYKECGTDLIASLFELHEIKKIFPKYNTVAKFPRKQYAIYKYMDQNGYLRLKAGSKRENINCFLGTFTTLSKARTVLYQLADDYRVCNYLNGLVSKDKLCSEATLGNNCACNLQIGTQKYNAKFRLIADKINENKQNKMIKLRGTVSGENCLLQIENEVVRVSFVKQHESEDMESLSWTYIPNIAETRQILALYFREKINF